METASGTEAEAVLRVLSLQRVETLRNEIFQYRSEPVRVDSTDGEIGSDTGADQRPAENGQQLLIQAPIEWLVRAGLASNRGLLLLGVLVGLAFQTDMIRRVDFDRVFGVIPPGISTLLTVLAVLAGGLVLLAILGFFKLLGVVWYALRFYGYRLSRQGEDLRISCGLLTKISATVPRRRIQFISIHRSLLMRMMGYSAIRIETAGGAGKENEDATATVSRRWFIPVLPDQFVPGLLEQLRPGLDWDEQNMDWRPLAPEAGRRMVRLAVIQSLILVAGGVAIGFMAPGVRAWSWAVGVVLMPLLVAWAIKKSRATRYARTDYGVSLRSGVMTRRTSLTFYDKIQTIRVDESPFDRRWKMATLSVDTAAAGPANHLIYVSFLDADFAKCELGEIRRSAAGKKPVWV